MTGAGSGIGEAIATRLANEGATVCIVDRNMQAATRVADAIRSTGRTALESHIDVSDRASVQMGIGWIRSHVGPVDALVNNAAVVSSAKLADLHEEDWERDIAVGLKGPFLCAQAVLPDMVEKHRGALLNIGSVNASLYLGDDAYSAAKAGLVSLTRSLAVQYGAHGIRANVIAPGTIRTPAWDARLDRDPTLLRVLEEWYPLGRIGTVDDIAAAASFLLSDEASWITGTVLTVDGGLLAGNALMARQILGQPR